MTGYYGRNKRSTWEAEHKLEGDITTKAIEMAPGAQTEGAQLNLM